MVGGDGGVGFAGVFAELGGKGEGFAGVPKTQLIQIVLIHAFEIAFGDAEDGFGESELAVAKAFGASSGIEEIGARQSGFGAGGLFHGPGGEGNNAAAPVKFAGPAFDGALGDADLAGGRRVAAARSQLILGTKGLKSTVGFPLDGGKGGRGGNGPGIFHHHAFLKCCSFI